MLAVSVHEPGMESGNAGIYLDENVTDYYWQECMKCCKSAALTECFSTALDS